MAAEAGAARAEHQAGKGQPKDQRCWGYHWNSGLFPPLFDGDHEKIKKLNSLVTKKMLDDLYGYQTIGKQEEIE